MNGQVIWITGLSGSGKTTIAKQLCQRINTHSLKPVLLDGDVLREVFSGNNETKKLYNRQERIALSRQYSLLCKNLSCQGFRVIIATISMFDEIYAWNRINFPNYFEVFLDVPIQELIRRDPKNIYKKFSTGMISNVAGLDLEVDKPQKSHCVVTFEEGQTPDQIVDIIVTKLSLEQI